MAFTLKETNRRQEIRRINTWFNTPTLYNLAPIDYVDRAVSQFLGDCQKLRFDLSIDKYRFYTVMCNLVCQLYDRKNKETTAANLYSQSLCNIPKPANWKLDYESKWLEYINYKYFDSTYWEQFWKTMPESNIDYDVFTWRTEFELYMPQFIERDIELLIDGGILYEEEDGTLSSSVIEEDIDNYN
jgi:hypothetical protein